ncbi:unnamed protein product [marine sediment metagenome]|uniref:Uncharacterized protein n=1 Tax=marine sediment metagenome TaxID=412755 RepID=X1ML01_9ZZZZ
MAKITIEERMRLLAKAQYQTQKSVEDLKPQIDFIKNDIKKYAERKPLSHKLSMNIDTFKCVKKDQPYKLVRLYGGQSLTITSRASGTDYIRVGNEASTCITDGYQLHNGESFVMNFAGIPVENSYVQIWVSSNVDGSELSYVIASATQPTASVEV